MGDLKDVCFDLDTWETVLDIFLRRWDDNKPKPMRMLLRSLSNLISRDPILDRRFAKKDYAVNKSLAIVNNQNETSSVKAAFQVLDHLLSKDLISATDIMCAYAVLDGVQKRAGSINSPERPHSSEATDESKSERNQHGRDLILAILSWILYSDVAADAGRLVANITQSFHLLSDATLEIRRPIWASPLHRFLQKHPESLEAVTNHVLPVLLKLNHNDALSFLQILPWENLRNGDSGRLSDADIVLCLSTADLAAEVQYSNGSGKQ